MAQTYLLPCPACQRKLPVEPAHAGAVRQCECGTEVTVPALREIKALEPADQAAREAPPSKWTRQQGVMFSLGILATILAVVLGFFPLMWRMQLSLEPPPPPDFTGVNAMVDAWTPAETLEAWDALLEAGVNRAGPPPHIAMRQVAMRLNVMIGITAVVALAGLASAIGAFFVGKK